MKRASAKSLSWQEHALQYMKHAFSMSTFLYYKDTIVNVAANRACIKVVFFYNFYGIIPFTVTTPDVLSSLKCATGIGLNGQCSPRLHRIATSEDFTY